MVVDRSRKENLLKMRGESAKCKKKCEIVNAGSRMVIQ